MLISFVPFYVYSFSAGETLIPSLVRNSFSVPGYPSTHSAGEAMCVVDALSIEIACSIWPGLDRGVGGLAHLVWFRSRVGLDAFWSRFVHGRVFDIGLQHTTSTSFFSVIRFSSAYVLSEACLLGLDTQFVHQFCLGEYAVLGGSLAFDQGTVYRTFLIPRHLFDSFPFFFFFCFFDFFLFPGVETVGPRGLTLQVLLGLPLPGTF